ncbi:RIKEN cDNA 3110005G23, isoform CRA_b, partial [Mus musculus]
RGYSQIYRSTRHLKTLALTIHSSGNTALLLLLCVQHSFPEPSKLYLELILAVLALELICSLSCLILYIGENGSRCPATSACLLCLPLVCTVREAQPVLADVFPLSRGLL